MAEQVLSAGFLRNEGNWVQWERDLQFISFGKDSTGPWQGFQAWRADFDSILLNRAKVLGVNVLQPCCASRLLVKKNRVIGVETSQGAFRSSFVIDAAGNQHWLARQLGLDIDYYSPRLIARYGYVEGECPTRDDAPVIVANQQGWTWTARVCPQLYQWTRLPFNNEQVGRDWLPNEFHGLKPRGRPCSADVTWRIVNRPAGPGYFIAGDAAAVLDPASSHGVLRAIMSGMMAGYMITQILNCVLVELTGVQGYRQWVHDWFQHDIGRLRQLYTILPNSVVF